MSVLLDKSVSFTRQIYVSFTRQIYVSFTRQIYVSFTRQFYVSFTRPNQFLLDLGIWLVVFGADCKQGHTFSNSGSIKGILTKLEFVVKYIV